MRKCVRCDRSLDSVQTIAGRPRKYCSVECRRLHTRKLEVPSHCAYCGADLFNELKAGRPRNYCNKLCGQNKRVEVNRERRKFSRPCVECGTDFVGVTARIVFCSVECRSVANRKRAHARWLAEKQTRPATKSWICKWCQGEMVVPISYTGNRAYHDECRKPAKRANNRKKTLRRQKVSSRLIVTHEEIAERDGFVCHLCGEIVDMDLPRTSRMGATLDHVIPLSRGGVDEKDNLKLAHWICNVGKSNKLMDELNV